MKESLKLEVLYTDTASNNCFEIPAVYTRSGVLISHIRYLAWYSEKSESWRERSVFSVRLLIDYIEATPTLFKTTVILKSFTEALVTGTIDFNCGNDRLRLFWKPRNLPDANSILFHITHYTDFLSRQDNYKTSLINPFRKATNWEQRMFWCAYYHKQANVFLNHLSAHSEAQKLAIQRRLVYTPDQFVVQNDKAERFPEDKIETLLQNGFVVRGKHDYRSKAITMLLNYGGLRKSEIFHIYIADITVHPKFIDEAMVRVYHPSYGASPDFRYKNRAEYLQMETKYKPRNKYRRTERLYSGWKNPLLTSKDACFEVIFNPPGKANEFLDTWIKYLKYQRIESDITHPYAFTNDNGEPDTLKNFQRRHKRAVERIGLECKKAFGTTEHGHRHAYGYRARKLGLSQVELQKAMHHKSPNSCLIYISPTNDDIRAEMRKLEE